MVVSVIVTDVVVGVIVTYFDVSVVVVVGVGVRACMRVYIGERERETFLLPFVFVLMPKEYADAQRMGSRIFFEQKARFEKALRPDGPTDRRKDERTDRPSYRDVGPVIFPFHN